jgi:5-formyltetrahydrofolate cyclo-ligase
MRKKESSKQQTDLTSHASPVTSHEPPVDRSHLRSLMRAKRNAVPTAIRMQAAAKIARCLFAAQILRRGQHIGVYAAFDGEIDLKPLMHRAIRAQCRLYAPRIIDRRARKMEFVELQCPSTAFRGASRQGGIPNSRQRLRRSVNPRTLDAVLIPVVAFDMHGWRLGFGAGFYDRKFAFARRKVRRQPLLIGVGYEFQGVPQQSPAPWDVLLDIVVTEKRIYWCRSSSS